MYVETEEDVGHADTLIMLDQDQVPLVENRLATRWTARNINLFQIKRDFGSLNFITSHVFTRNWHFNRSSF